MTSWNKEAAADLLLKSAEIALAHYDSPVRELKKDNTIVTQADREIENFLAQSLDKPGEGSYLIGEETLDKRSEAYIEAALAGRAWIADPIDGTVSYAWHFPMWGISLGYAEERVIREGALYLPIEGELLVSEGPDVYHGRRGADGKISLKPFAPKLENKIQAQTPHSAHSSPPKDEPLPMPIALAQKYARGGGFSGSNTLHTTGSTVFSAVHLILGHYLAYRADMKLWDIAGAIALLTKLGFHCVFTDGTPFTTRIDESVYTLAPTEERWRIRREALLARSPQAAEYVISCFS